jgi:DNA-binding MarR family transcriptional regulator
MTTMDDRLVQNMSQILRLLLRDKTHTNSIIKQTGIYKNNVFEAIKYLEKAGLATRFKDKKVHRQKVFIQLKEFGQQLADFIENAEKFEKSFDDLRNTITRVYDLPKDAEEKVIHSLLLDRGLNRQEIDSYKDHILFAEAFESDSMSVLIDGIIRKYALFLLEFSPNNFAKDFLKEIITRKLSNYLIIRIENIVKDAYFRSEKYAIDLPKHVTMKNRTNEMVEEISSLFFYFVKEQVNYTYKNRHIRNEVKNIVSSLFSIFHLPKESIEQKLKEEIEFIETHPPRKISPYLDVDQVRRSNEIQMEIYNYVGELNISA